MNNSTNLNQEMQKLADYASNAAKERFGHSLDFSESSLQQLESLLDLAYKRFSELKLKGTLTEEAVQRTTQIWGSYLGEVIRRKWGGNWENRNGEIVMVVKGIEVYPIKYVHQLITVRPDYPVKKFYDVIIAKFPPLPPPNQLNQTGTPLSPPNGINQQPSLPVPSTSKASFGFPRKWLYAIFGVGALSLCLILIVAAVAVIFFIKQNSLPQGFKTNLNTFLSEAQKLDIMTSQGVNNGDFSNQLVEVKSAYLQIGDSWPSSWSDIKYQFDQALEGWDLVLTAWGEKLDSSDSYYYWGGSNAYNYSQYLYGVSGHGFAMTKYDNLIGSLMLKASSCFDQGKIMASKKLK